MLILIVEDDPAIRNLAVQVLNDEGYSTRAVQHGAEALAALRLRPPDLIVLDLMMPVMDGVAFVERCRELPNCHDVPILIMSAAGMRHAYSHLPPSWEYRLPPCGSESCGASSS